MASFGKAVLLLIVLLLAALILLAIIGGQSGKAELVAMTPEQRAARVKRDDLESAKTACREFTKGQLNDPESAQFTDQETWPATEDRPNEFHMLVDVRARNAFNALVLGEFDCIVSRAAGSWRPVSVIQIR